MHKKTKNNNNLKVTITALLSLFISIISFNQVTPAKVIKSDLSIHRLAGADRYETSILVSKAGWSDTSDNVIIATGENFPDSLCAAPLAAKLKAPILLTNGKLLNNKVMKEVVRLKPKNAYIIGGQGAIPSDTEKQLKDMQINTIRVAGKDRYETSINIAKLVGSTKRIFVTTGENFPDAISIAAIAAKEGAPIILTDKVGNSKYFKDYISSNRIGSSYVIGGPAVLSDEGIKQLPNAKRIYGGNRYKTNIEIINTFIDELDLSNAYIMTGENFPDALCGAALAGLSSSPVILTSINEDEATNKFYRSINSFVKNINILGGENVVPSRNIDVLPEAANAQKPIFVPTYDGSNQSCHPKVLYFANGFKGWKYWMVFTPYPNGYDVIENPSIAVSNSGTKWEVPKGLINPITPTPQRIEGHNSDPHLVYDEAKDQIEMWYRFSTRDNLDKIYRMISKDGIHWSKPELMISFGNKQLCLSPAIIIENDKYKMWYINEDLKAMYIESSDGYKWSQPTEINFKLPDTYVPWHIDVVHTDKGYETVFSGDKRENLTKNSRVLFWSISNDEVGFQPAKIIMEKSSDKKMWDSKQIYRSTFVKIDGVYKLFYSAMGSNNEWHIGLSQGYSLDDLHGYNGNTK